jgi:hypothetical protein
MEFEVAVVKDIVLDNTSKYFTNAGEWNGVGTVYFQKAKGNSYKSRGFAKPYFSNFANYPLLEELIYIFKLPSPSIQENNFKATYYYICPLSIWNSNHHNGIPNIFDNQDLPDSQKLDYEQTQAGAVRRIEGGSTDIVLGQTFQERPNIKPVKKFEGDVILEGRLGNSIRLGSTIQKGSTPLNTWSSAGTNGDPILILRNGQGDSGSVGYLPTEENINTDPSSIYLTTTQQIPFTPASTGNYLSFGDQKPTEGNKYVGSQVIINSGRVFINSKTDHVLLSSNKSVSISAIDSINVDTAGDAILQAGKVKLGSQSATEPVLLGDTAVTQLETVIGVLKELLIAAAAAANGGGPIPSFVQKVPGLLQRLETVNLKTAKSSRTFTI